MENISEIYEISKDLEFGFEEMDIVQESYFSLLRSTNVLKSTINVSNAAIKLHRIQTQSLADRLGVKLSSVAIENFSEKTMHSFALEESEGFFTKIGKAIVSIFKWIKNKIVAFFDWVVGLFTGKKAETNKKVVEAAAGVIDNIEVKDKTATATVKHKKTNDLVTETRTVGEINLFVKSYMENPKTATDTLLKLQDIYNGLLKISESDIDASDRLGVAQGFIENPETLNQMGTSLNSGYKKHIESEFTKIGLREGGQKISEYCTVGYTNPSAKQVADVDFSDFKVIVQITEKFKQETQTVVSGYKFDKRSVVQYIKQHAELLDRIKNLLKDRKKTLQVLDTIISSSDEKIKLIENEELTAMGPAKHEVYTAVKGIFTIGAVPLRGTKSALQALVSFYTAVAMADHRVYQLCKVAVDIAGLSLKEIDEVMKDKSVGTVLF